MGGKITAPALALDQRSWENDEGQKRSFVEVVADNVAINVWTVDSVTRRQRQSAPAGASAPSGAPADSPW